MFSSSGVTMPMPCQPSNNNKLKDRAREAALTSDSSSPCPPLGKHSRFQMLQGLCGFLLAAPNNRQSDRNAAKQEDCPSPGPSASKRARRDDEHGVISFMSSPPPLHSVEKSKCGLGRPRRCSFRGRGSIQVPICLDMVTHTCPPKTGRLR